MTILLSAPCSSAPVPPPSRRRGRIPPPGSRFAHIRSRDRMASERREGRMPRALGRVGRAGSALAVLAMAAGATAQPAARPPKQYTIEQFMATTTLNGASFSSDEKRILCSASQTGVFNVDSVAVAGGEPQAITRSTTENVVAVSYFPADDRILFTRDQGGNELDHLYVRETDGQERDLTPGEKLKATFA